MASRKNTQIWPESTASAELVAVCLSPGGLPKLPVPRAQVNREGLAGDGHLHKKHRRLHRAVSIQDLEVLEDLKAGGYPVGPGIIGENLTVRGAHVQTLAPGDRLHFEHGPLLELTEPRKPCFVLDQIDPTIKDALVGRCGFLARVIKGGQLIPGQRISIQKGPGP